MKRLLIIFTILFIFPFVSQSRDKHKGLNSAHRYYYNPVYLTKEFQDHWPKTFKTLPKTDEVLALKKAEKDPKIKKILKEDPSYFLIPLNSSYTDNYGKSWTDWEIGVGRVVMNHTIRIDAVFSVNPISGKITKQIRPIIHMPFSNH